MDRLPPVLTWCLVLLPSQRVPKVPWPKPFPWPNHSVHFLTLPAIIVTVLVLAWGTESSRRAGSPVLPGVGWPSPFNFLSEIAGSSPGGDAAEASAESSEAALERAGRLRQEGAYEEAAVLYRSLLDRDLTTVGRPDVIAAAAAESHLAAGAYAAAIEMADRALTLNPARSDTGLVKGEALDKLGDDEAARAAFESAAADEVVGAYASFRAAEVAAGAEYPIARRLYAQAIDQGLSPWWEIVAARRLGRSFLVAGDPESAISWLRRAERVASDLGERGIPVWFDGEMTRRNSEARRAPILLDLARAQRQDDDQAAGLATYAEIVRDYPTTTEARDALGALRELGGAGLVSAFDRGRVLLNTGSAGEAVTAFTTALSPDEPGEAGAVRYNLGLARRASGDASGAIDELSAMARSYPRNELAPDALLQVARLTEATVGDDDPKTLAAYRAVVDSFPSSAAASRALMRIAWLHADYGERDMALDAWERLGRNGTDATTRAEGLFWLGRGLLGQGKQAEGMARLAEAAQLAPAAFEGIRARDLSEGGRGAEPFARQWKETIGAAPTDDAAACFDWIGSWANADPGADSATMVLDRVDRLLAVGQRGPALSEALAGASFQSRQPYDLYRLSVGLADRRLFAAAIRAADRLGAVSPARSSENGPACLQRLAYPLVFPDLVQAEAQRVGLDPFYVTALLRQESWFNTHAVAAAGEHGMSQVIPATRRAIAEAMGRPEVTDEDLYRPREAIAFGTFYLAQMNRTFDARPLLALAGYNAGPGNARRWMGASGSLDTDEFVEEIDYPSTRSYVRSIYQIYTRYHSLY